MDIHIDSPEKQFLKFWSYYMYMFKNLDVRRILKYLLFTFSLTLFLDLRRLDTGQTVPIDIPFGSLLVSVSFALIFFTKYLFMRKLYWQESVIVTKNKLIFSSGRIVDFREIRRIILCEDRIIEIVIRDKKYLILYPNFIDIVLPSKKDRDALAAFLESSIVRQK